MGKVIPDFSVVEINTLENYHRFRHCMNYIQQKSKLINKKPELLELMKASGYSKQVKFIKHRKLWDNFQKPIPLSYLKHLGVDLDVLAAAQEVDYMEFEEAKKLKLFPRYAIVRIIAAFYQQHTFPDNCNEIEAIEIMKEICLNLKTTALITYPGFKIIYIKPTNAKYSYIKPVYQIKKNHIYFGNDGASFGLSTI